MNRVIGAQSIIVIHQFIPEQSDWCVPVHYYSILFRVSVGVFSIMATLMLDPLRNSQ